MFSLTNLRSCKTSSAVHAQDLRKKPAQGQALSDMELLESVRVARTESAQLALGANVNQQGVLVAVVICLATMSITSVLAAPRQIEDFCFERLEYATLALRQVPGRPLWPTA